MVSLVSLVVAAASILGLVSLASPAGAVVQSSRVFPGEDGRLIYVSDEEGNRIPDFSNAGYRGGGVNLPEVKVVAQVGPIQGDNTVHLQAAINAAEQWSVDENGLRGALQLLPGDYPVSGSLFIRTSGFVLRGSGTGANPSQATIIRRTGNNKSNVIQIGIGSNHGFSAEIVGTRRNIITDRVVVGDRSFDLEDATDYAVGDHIVVYHPCTLAWLEAVDFGGTGSDEPWAENSQPLVFARTITAIDGNRITIDAPVFNTMDRLLSQSYIYRQDRSSVLRNIGVEHLRVTIESTDEFSEDHARSAIVYTETEDCWVRSVITEHFRDAGVLFQSSTRCTVTDTRANDPHSLLQGGRRYNFNVKKSQLILFEDCYASNARHAFAGSGASSDNGRFLLKGL